METSIRTFQIQLYSQAYEPFVNELTSKGVKFFTITRWSLIVRNTPKVRTAIQLVKERFGRDCIYITNAEC